ncbi:unnamed protein product [Arabidopsis halleri]
MGYVHQRTKELFMNSVHQNNNKTNQIGWVWTKNALPRILKLPKNKSNRFSCLLKTRRQSTRKRPLTTRALEALESGFLTPKSMKTTTSKPRKRERSAKIKHSANASNKTPSGSENGFHVKEATTSKLLDQIKDPAPSFLVDKVTTTSKHVEQIEDSKKVTTEFPKLPPLVLKLPFKRG